MLKRSIILFLLILVFLPAKGQTDLMDSITIDLYKGAVPNSLKVIEEITAYRKKGGRFVSNTSIPTLTCYQAFGNSKKAVVIFPGGGYSGLAIDKEGFLVARAFQQKGIHAFVVKYRTPLDASCIDKSIAPLQDAQQALRIAKEQLKSWGGTNIAIGVMGFSAGGHLAALTTNKWDYDYLKAKQEKTVKPDFSILIYPVITMEEPFAHMGSRENLLGSKPNMEDLKIFSAEYNVNQSTPATFLIHASDDSGVPVKNSLLYYEACIKNNVPVEMHLYERGGHGFGMYNEESQDAWMERMFNWLEK